MDVLLKINHEHYKSFKFKKYHGCISLNDNKKFALGHYTDDDLLEMCEDVFKHGLWILNDEEE